MLESKVDIIIGTVVAILVFFALPEALKLLADRETSQEDYALAQERYRHAAEQIEPTVDSAQLALDKGRESLATYPLFNEVVKTQQKYIEEATKYPLDVPPSLSLNISAVSTAEISTTTKSLESLTTDLQELLSNVARSDEIVQQVIDQRRLELTKIEIEPDKEALATSIEMAKKLLEQAETQHGIESDRTKLKALLTQAEILQIDLAKINGEKPDEHKVLAAQARVLSVDLNQEIQALKTKLTP